MRSLGVLIGGVPFDHLTYHFVLTYSNWETTSICFSESFESLAHGLQQAVWELGGVPERHQTDRLTAAVQHPEHREEFTCRYQALLDHYRMAGQTIQAGKANENGDVEQRHHRFKTAVDQALMLRGSRDFVDRVAYERFLREVLDQLNSGRRGRFEEELQTLKSLPSSRLDTTKRFPDVAVSRGSLIRILNNSYSVDSRLIGERVTVILHAEHLEVRYAGRCVERIERLRGEGKHRVQYRHIVDWLVRKPGAFDAYRYREDLFPSSRFRRVYDELKTAHSLRESARRYVGILKLAADEGELRVEAALTVIQDAGGPLTVETVLDRLGDTSAASVFDEVQVAEVNLQAYDTLLDERELLNAGC
jgi:hypothetical protein